MHHNTATHKTANTARHWAEDTLESAEGAVQTTRKLANASLDKAESRMRRLRQEIDPGVNNLAQRAQELATRGIQYCAETTDRARRRIGHAADATGRYVAEQPGKSLLLAAVAGAALATAIGYAARARRR
ncbi:hypothetical protein YS110_09600 [Acidovorax sp. YS12]|jgi:ElaB/YqjD/DUF883 family membrane-anchored ribosome-binding protein|nr:hypothetical protein YS110_09600 [Acidovorax sp. YS12]